MPTSVATTRDAVAAHGAESTRQRGHRSKPSRRHTTQECDSRRALLSWIISRHTKPVWWRIPPAAPQHDAPLHPDLLVLAQSRWKVRSANSSQMSSIRGIFTSVADLKRKIPRYIRLYQRTARRFRWKYSDPRQRVPAWWLADSPLVTGWALAQPPRVARETDHWTVPRGRARPNPGAAQSILRGCPAPLTRFAGNGSKKLPDADSF